MPHEYRKLTQSKMTIPTDALLNAHIWGAAAGLGPMDTFNEAVRVLLACELRGRDDLVVRRARGRGCEAKIVNVRIEHMQLWGLKAYAESYGITQSSAMTIALDTLVDADTAALWNRYAEASAARRDMLSKALGVDFEPVSGE